MMPSSVPASKVLSVIHHISCMIVVIGTVTPGTSGMLRIMPNYVPTDLCAIRPDRCTGIWADDLVTAITAIFASLGGCSGESLAAGAFGVRTDMLAIPKCRIPVWLSWTSSGRLPGGQFELKCKFGLCNSMRLDWHAADVLRTRPDSLANLVIRTVVGLRWPLRRLAQTSSVSRRYVL